MAALLSILTFRCAGSEVNTISSKLSPPNRHFKEISDYGVRNFFILKFAFRSANLNTNFETTRATHQYKPLEA
ncbi:hypothetical protein N9N71_01510 [Synechococcus sp. AH-229-G18]|nr:hypothetical protein [Synechococcus sp. AH-229-G18]